MQIDPLAAALWIADFLGTAALLFFLFRFRLARQWPSLVALLSTDIVFWIALAAIHSHFRWYWYTYWIWTAVDSALKLWLLADCLRSIPGTGFIPPNARRILFITAALMAVGAGLFALHADGVANPAKCMKHAILLYNQSACFAMLAFCAVIFSAIARSGLGWERTGARIASGLGLELAVYAFKSAALLESLRRLRAAADYATNFSDLLVLLVWIFAIFSSRKRFVSRPSSRTPPHIERRVLQPI